MSTFRESLRLTQNIARQLGINCQLKVLYLDNNPVNCSKIKNAVESLQTVTYKLDTTTCLSDALHKIKDGYDVLIVNNTVQIDSEVEYPLAFISDYIIQNKDLARLGYIVDNIVQNALSYPCEVTTNEHFNTQIA